MGKPIGGIPVEMQFDGVCGDAHGGNLYHLPSENVGCAAVHLFPILKKENFK